jgi:rod shape-determining protein MreD
MSGYLSIPVLALAVIVQSTLIPEIQIGGAMPDLVLLLALAWTLMAGFQTGSIWAMVGGVLQDLVSATPVGTTSLALVIVVGGASLVLGRVNPRNLIYPALAAGPGTLAAHLVILVVLALTGRPVPLNDLLVHVTLPSMVYNMAVMVPVYRVMGGFYISSRPHRVIGLEE